MRGEDASGDGIRIARGMRMELVPAENNPSARREGILIHFSCEACHERPVLEIDQHKGPTFARWRAKGAPERNSGHIGDDGGAK